MNDHNEHDGDFEETWRRAEVALGGRFRDGAECPSFVLDLFRLALADAGGPDELEAEDADELREHLQVCPVCRNTYLAAVDAGRRELEEPTDEDIEAENRSAIHRAFPQARCDVDERSFWDIYAADKEPAEDESPLATSLQLKDGENAQVGRHRGRLWKVNGRRHWFRYSMRAVFVAVTLLALWFGYEANKNHRERRVIGLITEAGGSVEYSDPDSLWSRIVSLRSQGPVQRVRIRRPSNELLDSLKNLQGAQLIDINGVSDDGLAKLAELTNRGDLADVIFLNLSHSDEVTDEGIAHLGEIKGLAALSISRGRRENETLRQLRRLKELRVLDLYWPWCGDDGIREVVELKQLRMLTLRHAHGITRDGLALLKTLPHLEVLRFECARVVTDETAAELSGLKKVVRLELEEEPVSDDGLKHLCNMALNRLSLEDTEITDRGLAHVSAMTGLEVLVLNGTKITDEGLKHLLALENLKALQLDGTDITDAGVRYLEKMTSLVVIDLQDTLVTDAAIARLRRALPGAAISG